MENNEIILFNWLEEAGFINDRGWKKQSDKSHHFYSFSKGKYRFEIKVGWDKIFDFYTPIEISLLDCEKEVYSDFAFIGWFGQRVLLNFRKEISKELFDEICKHYEII